MEPITYQMIKKAVRQLKKNAYSYPAIPIHIGTGNGCIHYIAKTPEQAYDFIRKTVAAYAAIEGGDGDGGNPVGM